MGINIIKELYFDGCQSIIREMEQKSPDVIAAQKEVEKIRDEILRTTPQLKNLFDRYEEAETRVKEEESFDLFQEGFVLGFLFVKKINDEIIKRSEKEGKDERQENAQCI